LVAGCLPPSIRQVSALWLLSGPVCAPYRFSLVLVPVRPGWSQSTSERSLAHRQNYPTIEKWQQKRMGNITHPEANSVHSKHLRHEVAQMF